MVIKRLKNKKSILSIDKIPTNLFVSIIRNKKCVRQRAKLEYKLLKAITIKLLQMSHTLIKKKKGVKYIMYIFQNGNILFKKEKKIQNIIYDNFGKIYKIDIVNLN